MSMVKGWIPASMAPGMWGGLDPVALELTLKGKLGKLLEKQEVGF